MIISRAPLRISLAGGGSDLPAYLKFKTGKVLSFTINKYVYLAMHGFFSGGIRISYSLVEQVKTFEEINHPIFRETMRALDFNHSIEIGSFADVPSNGTGLGSSSAFTNALILGLKRFQNMEFTQRQAAALACEIEINRCGHPIGLQDQWASAIGGINKFDFFDIRNVEYESLYLSSDAILSVEQSMRLYYLGQGRSAGGILSDQERNIVSDNRYRMIQDEIVSLVDPMRDALLKCDIAAMGKLLDEGWALKQQLSNGISSSSIQEIYKNALNSGAIGGKVLGAGGGGFLLLCIPPENQEKFDLKFTNLRALPFNIEFTGATVVYDDGDTNGL